MKTRRKDFRIPTATGNMTWAEFITPPAVVAYDLTACHYVSFLAPGTRTKNAGKRAQFRE